jgi:hypothetical protein
MEFTLESKSQTPRQMKSLYSTCTFVVLITGILMSFVATSVESYVIVSPQSSDSVRSNGQRSWTKISSTRIYERNNEWGIPYSSTLPPLVPSSTTKRKSIPPKTLPNGGKVTLLGSGPGDPDLLTVAAYRLLSTYDPNVLVIADRLVSPEVLKLVASETKVARKLPGCAELAQEEIYWWTYQALNQGKHVIRLKIGDPFVFGRGGEEVLQFRKFGVEPTVIPVRTRRFLFDTHVAKHKS